MSESPFIKRTFECISTYVLENFNGDIKDEIYMHDWLEEHIFGKETKIKLKFENCEEMAEALSFIIENDEYSDFRPHSRVTVDKIMSDYLYLFVTTNYEKVFN